MTDINALIERVEAATGPSGELDAAILDATCERQPDAFLEGGPRIGIPMWRYPDGHVGTALRYTASVDAALTLVPEGLCIAMTFSLTTGSWYGKQAVVQLRTGSLTDPTTEEWDGDASTPALALCVAALRARAALAGRAQSAEPSPSSAVTK